MIGASVPALMSILALIRQMFADRRVRRSDASDERGHGLLTYVK
jgi:hypothetical protein